MPARRTLAALTAIAATAAVPAAAGAKTTHHAPKLPRDAKMHRVAKVRHHRHTTGQAHRVVIKRHRATPAALGRLFGYEGTYENKLPLLLESVNDVYSQVLGDDFQQPGLFEVPDGGTTDEGCGPETQNAEYCGDVNEIAWSGPFLEDIFNRDGDAAAAAILAHEYGHFAAQMLGFADEGAFRYTLPSEGFADCMAGAWVGEMADQGLTDSASGADDADELINVMTESGDDGPTTIDGHGDAAWRTAVASYGYENGFDACIAWGQEMAGV
jgi:predicted metalloprotease